MLKYFHILVIIFRTILELHRLKKIKCNVFQLKNSLLMLMAPLYYHEMVEIHHTQKKVKKKLVKS